MRHGAFSTQSPLFPLRIFVSLTQKNGQKKFSLYCTWAGLSRCIRIGKLYAYFEGPYRPAIPPGQIHLLTSILFIYIQVVT